MAAFCGDGELSDIVSKLWDMDKNKCHQGTDYDLNLQGYVGYRETENDRARDSLFDWVDENVFSRPTYKTFCALLDNFEMEVGTAEVTTQEERQEVHEFLDAMMDTDVMKEAHKFLVEKGKADSDENKFKRQLHDIWFRMFAKNYRGRVDSCSFEHVFVGEGRGEELIGLHNWIQFYLQEKAGNIDYHGYFKRSTKRDDEELRLLAVQFDWRNQKCKPMCSVFVGSSPEFEIAAYTICLLLDRDGKLDVQMGEYEVEITVHSHGRMRKLGTAYIAAARMEQHGKQYYKNKK